MNPWTLIGWILLGTLGLVVALFTLGLVRAFIGETRRQRAHMRAHRETCDTPPAAGQEWTGLDGRRMEVIGASQERISVRFLGFPVIVSSIQRVEWADLLARSAYALTRPGRM